MFNIIIFVAGAAIMFYMALRSARARRRLCAHGEKVAARVAGEVQGKDGAAYVLEFATAGGTHRLQYSKPSRGKALAQNSEVTLYYDPDDPQKMYVEGDRAVLGAELLYTAMGVAMLVLLLILTLRGQTL